MAVNQPPIPDDPALAAWMLEVTREINELRFRERALVQQITTEQQARIPAFVDGDVIDNQVDTTRNGSLILSRDDNSTFTYNLSDAINSIPVLSTGSIKAQVISTTDRAVLGLPRTTGASPTPDQRIAVFDPDRNPAQAFGGLNIAAGALPPSSAWFVTVFSDDTALGDAQLFFSGVMIRTGVFQADSIINSFARRGLDIRVFANQIPEVFIEQDAQGSAVRDLIITTLSIHNETGIRRE